MSELQSTRTIDVVAAEIRALTATMLNNVIEIGRRMCEAKEMLPYGTFGKWVEESTGYSQSTANNFMKLYKEYGAAQGCLFGAETESQTIGKLSYSKALALLSLPAAERESFAEEHHVEDMSTKELKQAIKERNEAREAKEEAENRAAGYEAKLKTAKKEKEEAAAAAAGAQRELERLQNQLRELQETPAQVAVEKVADEEAIAAAAEKAKQETEAALAKKIEKAEKAKAAAEKAKEKADQELAALKVAQEEKATIAEREKAAMAEQVDDLRKKLAVASSSEMVIFKLHFGQGQESINKMAECITKMEEAGNSENADKLKNALRSLLEKALEALK